MVSFLNNYLVSLVTVAGLIVLVAMGKATYAEVAPAILLLAGVHVGANASTPTATVVEQPVPVVPVAAPVTPPPPSVP